MYEDFYDWLFVVLALDFVPRCFGSIIQAPSDVLIGRREDDPTREQKKTPSFTPLSTTARSCVAEMMPWKIRKSQGREVDQS